MSVIPITGVGSSYLVPGAFLELNLAQGVSTAAAPGRDVIYVMPKLSTGTWTANTVYQVTSESQVIEGAGAGSPLHRAIRKHLSANKTSRVYALPYAATSGAGATSADGYFTFSGTATGSGIAKFSIGPDEFTVGFKKDDTATVIAGVVVEAVNAATWLPVTAANVSGKVTLTAKIAGDSQGDGTIGVIRFDVEVTSSKGITVIASGTALGLDDIAGGGTAGADGSTTDIANLTTALAAIANTRKYFVGISSWKSTALAALNTHIVTKSSPIPGLRSVGVAGFTGTLATAQSNATTLNSGRMTIINQPNSLHDVAELVGNLCAVGALETSTKSQFPFVSYRKSGLWNIKKVKLDSDRPSSSAINDAMSDGVTVVASDDSGSYLVDWLTTQSKNAAGTYNDTRALYFQRLSVGDDLGDTILIRHSNTYAGFNIRPDVVNSNGVVDPNARRIPQTVTPSDYKVWLIRTLKDFENDGKIVDLASTLSSLYVGIDPSNSRRLEVKIDFDVIESFAQATFQLNEVSSS